MNEILKKVLVTTFIIVAFTLYVLFIFFTDNVPVKELEYIGILLCFGFSYIIYDTLLDTWTVRIALFFTAIADLFLLLMVGYEVIGVIVFSIVQLIYGIRLMFMVNRKLTLYKSIKLRLVFIIIFQLIGLIIVKNYNLLILITLFYLANLVTNVVLAIYHYKTNTVFAIGLFLFLCCDIFVGLNNSQDYLNISGSSIWNKLLNLPIDLIWFFYFPSQVLITISILTNKVILTSKHRC
ncbi:hypothetical protein KHQ81_00880 [Mycoplasmatota bacterium]|nr:hypothetical protein KHQ81_00880 [Mycoplasmatota bacterium]